MNDHLQIFSLSIFTMVCWGLSNGLMKRPSLAIGSARAIRFRQAVMTIVIIAIYFYSYNQHEKDLGWYSVSFLLGMFGYIPFFFFCQALQIGSIGVVNAIGNSFPLVVSFLSVLFLDLELKTEHWIGIIVTVLGVATLSLGQRPNSRKRTPEHSPMGTEMSLKAFILSLLACILWGVFFTSVQIPNSVIGFIPHTLMIQMGSLFSAEIHIRLARIPRRNISTKTLWGGFFAGFLAILGSISFYKALDLGNPGIVTAIAGTSPIIGAIFGYLVLKEKISRIETTGILLAVAGVILLSLAK